MRKEEQTTKAEKAGQAAAAPIQRNVMSSNFCDACQWLSPTEAQQDTVRQSGAYLSHECRWYHKILFHHGNHPHIVKCDECVGYVQSLNYL